MNILSSQKIQISHLIWRSVEVLMSPWTRIFSPDETSLPLLDEMLLNPSQRSIEMWQSLLQLAAVFKSHAHCGIFKIWNAHFEGLLLTQGSFTAWYIWGLGGGQQQAAYLQSLWRKEQDTSQTCLSHREKGTSKERKAFKKGKKKNQGTTLIFTLFTEFINSLT